MTTLIIHGHLAHENGDPISLGDDVELRLLSLPEKHRLGEWRGTVVAPLNELTLKDMTSRVNLWLRNGDCARVAITEIILDHQTRQATIQFIGAGEPPAVLLKTTLLLTV